MPVDHLMNTVDKTAEPVLMDVRCCNCRSLNTWQVDAHYAQRMLGLTVTFSCECVGNTVGMVSSVRGIGEAAHG